MSSLPMRHSCMCVWLLLEEQEGWKQLHGWRPHVHVFA